MSRSKKRKKVTFWGRIVNRLWVIIVSVGILIMVYPFISQQYYNYLSKQDVQDFKEAVNTIGSYEINKKMDLAMAYNQSLKPGMFFDPFNEKVKAGRAEYARMLEIHEKIGYIDIPKIGQKIIIKAGTSESVLQECAGHLEGTSLPTGGKNTHTVITAHRGLPSAKLFTNLNEMQKGDVFFITNIKEKLAYKVVSIKTVEPTDFDPIRVEKDKDYATLMTCTPYMINSHRLLVKGERIPINMSKTLAEENEKDNIFKKMIKYVSVLLILMIISIIIYKKKKGEKRICKNDKQS